MSKEIKKQFTFSINVHTNDSNEAERIYEHIKTLIAIYMIEDEHFKISWSSIKENNDKI